MTKRGILPRENMPRAIMNEAMIHAIRGRKRKAPSSKIPRAVCSRCGNFTRVIHIDKGYLKANDPSKKKRKRGRPSKEPKLIKRDDRREHIGYWCEHCKIFYYCDGSPDYRGATSS
jgi:hypothetical protein